MSMISLHGKTPDFGLSERRQNGNCWWYAMNWCGIIVELHQGAGSEVVWLQVTTDGVRGGSTTWIRRGLPFLQRWIHGIIGIVNTRWVRWLGWLVSLTFCSSAFRFRFCPEKYLHISGWGWYRGCSAKYHQSVISMGSCWAVFPFSELKKSQWSMQEWYWDFI